MRRARLPSTGRTARPSSVARRRRVEPVPFAERSRWAAKLARGEFVTSVEIVPPRGVDASRMLADVRQAEGRRRRRGERARRSARAEPHGRAADERADRAAGRHRDGDALRLPRPQPARHAERLVGRVGRWPPQPARHHRRSAEDGPVPRRDGGLRRRLDRPHESRQQPESRSRSRRQRDRPADAVRDRRRRESGGDRSRSRSSSASSWKVDAGAEFAITQPVFDAAQLEKFFQRDRGPAHSGHRRHLAARVGAQRRVSGERGARACRCPRRSSRGCGGRTRSRRSTPWPRGSRSRARCSSGCGRSCRACRCRRRSGRWSWRCEVFDGRR